MQFNGQARNEARMPTLPEIAAPARLLTVEEVADWLCVKPAWVRAHANGSRRPIIPSIKIGRSRRFRREDIERWLSKLAGVA